MWAHELKVDIIQAIAPKVGIFFTLLFHIAAKRHGIYSMVGSVGRRGLSPLYIYGTPARSEGLSSMEDDAKHRLASIVAPSPPAAPPVSVSAEQSTGGNQPDFRNMTLTEYRAWASDQGRSGKVDRETSEDLTIAFGRVPVNESMLDDGTADTQKIDFVQWAQDGLAGARLRRDDGQTVLLQKILAMMTGDQAPSVVTTESSLKIQNAVAAFRSGS